MPQGVSEDTAFILQKVYFFVTVSPNNTLPQSVLPRFGAAVVRLTVTKRIPLKLLARCKRPGTSLVPRSVMPKEPEDPVLRS